MEFRAEDVSYDVYASQGTGSHSGRREPIVVPYAVSRYEVLIELDSEGRFIGVQQVRLRKDFREYAMETAPRGFHDVEEFYQE